MNVVDIDSTVKTSLSCFTHKYSGDTNVHKFRDGTGRELWNAGNRQQSYIGSFLLNSLHGYGTYKWSTDNVNYTYEGQFYANNLEGYGQLSYPDGLIYEGLFSLNRRYGPGVLTHADGSQDVGLWDGLNLIRLNQTPSKTVVPRLTHSSKGRAYILQYKSLVPIQEKFNLINKNNLNNENLQDKNELSSDFVRNPNSVFFNQKLYYNSFFHNESDFTVDIMESMENGEPFTRKVTVTHLLAWNNEDLATSIMKHSFRHRNSENLLSYSVSDVLTGQRLGFKTPGIQEKLCLTLLESCCDDNERKIIKLICENDLYPDLADYMGNTGICYAASLDLVLIIKTLVDFGANVDHLNDECLTPLLISILRYLGTKNDVIDWEKAFLLPTESKDENRAVQEWRNFKLTDNKLSEGEKLQDYLFNLVCVHPIVKTNKDKKNDKKTELKNKKNIKIDWKPEKIEAQVNSTKEELLQKIYYTILVLLQSGADPNFGEVPFPPLILTLFTKNDSILSELIRFGADANITTSVQNGALSPLHIIVSLPPSPEMSLQAQVLLANGANPNRTANINHWIQERDTLLAGTQTFDTGKTPLHLLCMRWDFEDDICDHLGETFTMFVRYGADVTINYLGHTVLSLAIIRGNTRLMTRILESDSVNPNETLGNGMGVPLTVLTLKRYKDILPLSIVERVYNILLQFYANPLNSVSGFNGNTVEFALEENTLRSDEESDKKGGKKKKKNISKRSSGNEKVIKILKDCASETLDKYLQGKAVKFIYDFKIQCEINDDIFNEIAKFVNIEDTVRILQILVDSEKIIINKRMCFETLKFVNNLIKAKPLSKHRGKSKKPEPIEITVEGLFKTLNFNTRNEQIPLPFGLNIPEIDPDEEKYKICYECLRKINKQLILCPKCELVYFCSQDCNIINNKRPTKHQCKILFYDSEKQRLEQEGSAARVNKLDRFKKLKEMLENEPGFLEKLNVRYSSEGCFSSSRLSRKDTFEKGSKKRKKSKQRGSEMSYSRQSKSKGSKGRSRSRSKTRDKSDSIKKRNKSKSGSRVQDKSHPGKKKGRSKKHSELEDEGGRRNKKHKLKSQSKARDKSADKDKKKISKYHDKSTGKRKEKKSKSQSRDRDKSADKRKEKKSKSQSKNRDKSPGKGEDARSKFSKSQDRGKSKDKSKKERIKFGSKQRSKADGTHKKTAKERAESRWSEKSKMLKSTKEKRSTKGRSESRVRENEKLRGIKMRDTEGARIRSYSRETSKSRNRSKSRYELARKLKEGIVSHDYLNMISDICEFNSRFYEMFMPYCVFIDGQLYYKFDGSGAFRKLTYSNI